MTHTTRVGPYHLVRELGQGGMGETHPETRRALGELATLYERWGRRSIADSVRALAAVES